MLLLSAESHLFLSASIRIRFFEILENYKEYCFLLSKCYPFSHFLGKQVGFSLSVEMFVSFPFICTVKYHLSVQRPQMVLNMVAVEACKPCRFLQTQENRNVKFLCIKTATATRCSMMNSWRRLEFPHVFSECFNEACWFGKKFSLGKNSPGRLSVETYNNSF